MRLEFEKGAGRDDRLTVFRDDGTQEHIACPKQRIVPHDMVHYAVEKELDARGFLGRVHAGEAAAFTMGQEPESDSVERLVEAIQGDAWSGGKSPAMDVIAMYGVTCDARGCAPLDVEPDAILAIRRRLEDLQVRWDAVKVGETLTLDF